MATEDFDPDAQPGAAAAIAAGCTCPKDQPRKDERVYMADSGCPLHGLGMLAAELGVGGVSPDPAVEPVQWGADAIRRLGETHGQINVQGLDNDDRRTVAASVLAAAAGQTVTDPLAAGDVERSLAVALTAAAEAPDLDPLGHQKTITGRMSQAAYRAVLAYGNGGLGIGPFEAQDIVALVARAAAAAAPATTPEPDSASVRLARWLDADLDRTARAYYVGLLLEERGGWCCSVGSRGWVGTLRRYGATRDEAIASALGAADEMLAERAPAVREPKGGDA